MDYTLIKYEKFKTTRWAGGTTTELFIFPTDSEYQKRNFSFRLSTAKVEVEKSEFTSLPGISRKIMVLEGGILINHENHHSKQLAKFDVDEFEGDWKTTSTGKCTDFNLMTQGEIGGKITALIIEKNQFANYQVKDDCDWLFMYIFSGKA
ncbi:MAG TPA: HutD family protein, partial [Bacteroidales bacterium]